MGISRMWAGTRKGPSCYGKNLFWEAWLKGAGVGVLGHEPCALKSQNLG